MSDETELEIVMPFVTVASKGGPHDDDAYACGYEMGAIDAELASLAASLRFPSITVAVTIHAVNRPQADLVAMRHGFTCTWDVPEDPEIAAEWVGVTFTRGGGTS